MRHIIIAVLGTARSARGCETPAGIATAGVEDYRVPIQVVRATKVMSESCGDTLLNVR